MNQNNMHAVFTHIVGAISDGAAIICYQTALTEAMNIAHTALSPRLISISSAGIAACRRGNRKI
jgi:hypothetical protein